MYKHDSKLHFESFYSIMCISGQTNLLINDDQTSTHKNGIMLCLFFLYIITTNSEGLSSPSGSRSVQTHLFCSSDSSNCDMHLLNGRFTSYSYMTRVNVWT